MKTYYKYFGLLLVVGAISIVQAIFTPAWGARTTADGRYELVTDLSTLSSGGKYIIISHYQNAAYGMLKRSSTSAYNFKTYSLGSFSTTTPLEAYDISSTYGMAEFTIGVSDSYYYFHDGEEYLYCDGSSNNYLKASSTLGGDVYMWSITTGKNTGQWLIQCKSTSVERRTLRGEKGTTISCYKDNGYIYIYKYVPAVTLYDGPNGENKTTIAIGEYFPNDAADVAGWNFTGYWATAAHADEEPDYPSGALYNHGDAATAGTYYAIYEGDVYGCNWNSTTGVHDYSCKPKATYSLTCNNPTTGSGVNRVTMDVGCGTEGTTVTLTYYLDGGGTYMGATITRDDNNAAVNFTHDAENQTITFQFPASDVTVTVNFECPDLTGKNIEVSTPTITQSNYNSSTGKWDVRLTWGAVDGATRYKVTVADRTANTTIADKVETTNTYYDLELTTNHEYKAVVRARNNCDESYCEAQTEVFTPTCPEIAKPTISVSDVTSTGASVSWSSTTTGVSYDVTIKPASGAAVYSKEGTDETEWSSNSLTSGVEYTVEVVARNYCEGSSEKATATFKPKNYTGYTFTCSELVFEAPTDAPNDLMFITSTAGQVVRSHECFKISGSGLTPSTEVSFVMDDAESKGLNDVFTFRKKDNTKISTDALGAIAETEVYVFYNPSAATDGLDIFNAADATITASVAGTKPRKATAGHTVSIIGRHLPAAFVIAARIGKAWYALPANMTTTDNPTPVLIGVDDSAQPTIAYTDQSNVYDLHKITNNSSRFATDGNHIYFGMKNNSDYALWANNATNSTTIGKSGTATVSGDLGSNYYWKLQQTAPMTQAVNVGGVVYQITNPNNTNSLKLNRGQFKWGLYSAGIEEIRLLSFVETQPLTMDVMEWGETEIAVKYTGGGTLTKVQLGDDVQSSATMTPLTGDLQKIAGLSSMKAQDGGYQCQQLMIQVTESSVLKQKVLSVPFILTDTKTNEQLRTLTGESLAGQQDSVTYITDIVVRQGGMLQTTTNTGKYADLYIYPGGKADIQNKVRFTNIYLRGGFSWLDNKATYALPQMKVANGTDMITGIGASGHGVYYDMYADKTMFYMLALPKDVTVGDITNEEGTRKYGATIKYYSGKGRTETPQYSSTPQWTEITSYEDVLQRGVGYEIAIKTRNGRNLGILRFPLLKNTGWTNEATCTPAVENHGYANRTSIGDNNVGWNLIGNPYFTAFKNDVSGNANVAVEGFKEHIVDGRWDGTYEWDASKIKYYTIPNYTDYGYIDVTSKDYSLDAFYPFYIQSKVSGTLTFSSNKVLKAPATVNATMLNQEIEVMFTLTNEERESAKSGLFISDEYDAAFDMEDKEISLTEGVDELKIYTMVGDIRTAFNSLPEASIRNIPLGYKATTAGDYSISLVEGADLKYLQSAVLVDNAEGIEWDLLQGRYEFETAAMPNGNDTRFVLRIELKDEDEVVTGLWQEGATNSLSDLWIFTTDKSLTLHNLPQDAQVWLYDMTGKLVAGSNTIVGKLGTLNMTVPAQGVYNVRVVAANEARTIRVIVK